METRVCDIKKYNPDNSPSDLWCRPSCCDGVVMLTESRSRRSDSGCERRPAAGAEQWTQMGAETRGEIQDTEWARVLVNIDCRKMCLWAEAM